MEKIGCDEFLNRTGLKLEGIVEIVSFKEVTTGEEIKRLEMMPDKFLEKMLRNVPLLGEDEMPYKDARISNCRFHPGNLKIGQTFLQENKIINLLNVPKVFSGYASIQGLGLSKLPPLFIYFEKLINNEKMPLVAFYVPPIIEAYNNSFVILDGIHRSYISKGAGTSMSYIVVERKWEEKTEIDETLPFIPHCWQEINVVKEKPPIEERYFGLKRQNFRLLNHVGIDG